MLATCTHDFMVQRRKFALGDPSAGGLPASLAELAVLVGEHYAGKGQGLQRGLAPEGHPPLDPLAPLMPFLDVLLSSLFLGRVLWQRVEIWLPGFGLGELGNFSFDFDTQHRLII